MKLLEFSEGWEGLRKKSLLWGRYGYFLELYVQTFYELMSILLISRFTTVINELGFVLIINK